MNRADRIGLCCLFVAWLALFLTTRSQHLSIAHDSIHYLNVIEDGRGLYHPHHLLYFPLARLWLVTGQHLNPVINAVNWIEALNALFGALTLTLTASLLRTRFGLDWKRTLIATALPGLTYGFWCYSVSIEVYVIPLFFQLAAFVAATARPATRGRCAAAGLCAGAAILFHQTNILFLPALAAGLWSGGGDSARRHLGRAAVGVAIASLSAAAIYVWAIRTQVQPENTARWLTDYAGRGHWGRLTLSTPIELIVGWGRALVGGHFMLTLAENLPLIGPVLTRHGLTEERFLVRNLTAGEAWALLLASATAATLIASAAGAQIRRILRGSGEDAVTVRVWLLPYAIFFAWWEPDNPEFWLAPGLALWLLLTSRMVRSGRGWRRVAAAAVLLGAINGWGEIRLMMNSANDWQARRAAAWSEIASRQDLLIVESRWIVGDYLERYTDSEIACLTDRPDHGMERGQALIQRIHSAWARGGEVYLLREAKEHDGPRTAAMSNAADAFSEFQLQAVTTRDLPPIGFKLMKKNTPE